ncbi:hypothetical protein A2154_04500 [Candidatus Gottesmanbacteria bacterium RBG_16_43_7]|uniref:DUF5660 domain-containing protein n=1 Tax=Candidatus Gottesmanbacteria bacterium RBG_16_43_7 TaxID=1798373 RepID=A0A1F5Z7W4_9BACT|nr:MAG: hypothetical protein A2154_04500 [Candidatus Gottesmanbacteria bacterium RBG_16_43_7]
MIPKPPKKVQTQFNTNVLEALKDLGSGVGKSMARDVTGPMANDMLASLFGTPLKSSGELRPNQEVNIGQEQTYPQAPRAEIYRQPVADIVERDLERQIASIRQELSQLIASVKKLDTQIEKAVSETPVEPGVYHLNFFERLKNMILLLRQQVDNSSSWLAMFTTRKKRRMGYWGMYKKHGTTFGLSSERNIATAGN